MIDRHEHTFAIMSFGFAYRFLGRQLQSRTVDAFGKPYHKEWTDVNNWSTSEYSLVTPRDWRMLADLLEESLAKISSEDF